MITARARGESGAATEGRAPGHRGFPIPKPVRRSDFNRHENSGGVFK